MSDLNKVMLIGRLGQDPVHNVTSTNKDVTEFTLATSEVWYVDKEKKEKTEWHRIKCWGKTAITAKDHLKKGSQIYLEGKNSTRKWEDKEGNTRYTTEVVAHTIKFLGSPKGQVKASPPASFDDPNGFGEDIPF